MLPHLVSQISRDPFLAFRSLVIVGASAYLIFKIADSVGRVIETVAKEMSKLNSHALFHKYKIVTLLELGEAAILLPLERHPKY